MKNVLITNIIIILFVNKQRIEVDANSNLANFSETVKSRNLADKTLFIKDLLNDDDANDPVVKEITAPPRFGKSTIIDMVKKFVGIQVDARGKPVLPNATENYKLFCRRPLNVCRDKEFVSKHLGQHPVIHIDYRRMMGVIDLDSAIFEAREVLGTTFAEHSYLEHVDDLWPRLESISKEQFIEYIHPTKTIETGEIVRAFYLLSYVLHEHFGKKVIVLVDDYDAHVKKMIFRKIEELIDILDFCSGLNGRILKANNQYLYKALVMGTLSVSEIGNNARDYAFRSDHEFSKYFGYTSKEIEHILFRRIPNNEQREEKQKELESFYGGYTIQSQNESLFNMWSVLQFFKNKMKLAPYWAEERYIRPLNNIICNSEISEELVKLIKGRSYDLYINERFRKDDVLTLSRAGRSKDDDFEVYWFYLLLYSLGYLTISPTGQDTNSSLTDLKIPNVEMLIDLTRELQKCYKDQFGYSKNDVNELIKAVDGFEPGKVQTDTFVGLHNSLRGFLRHACKNPDRDDVQELIFVNLLDRFYQSKSGVHTLFKYNETAFDHGRLDILVMNSHKVAIVMKVKTKQAAELKENELESMALAGHDEIVRVLDNFSNFGRVYVGLAFHMNTGKISLACSSFSKSEGDFRNATIVNGRVYGPDNNTMGIL